MKDVEIKEEKKVEKKEKKVSKKVKKDAGKAAFMEHMNEKRKKQDLSQLILKKKLKAINKQIKKPPVGSGRSFLPHFFFSPHYGGLWPSKNLR
jgi:hypothetical protein